MLLSFIFAALVAILDQLFKRWTVIRLAWDAECGVNNLLNCICDICRCDTTMDLIPGVIRLNYFGNDGAMFGFLSGQRWLLAGIMLACIAVLVFILLRYDEGFWGTLGLSAVLGGAIGNFIDRVFIGYVVDMFEFQFFRFAVFNIADIFITTGALTFVVFFIITTLKTGKEDNEGTQTASAIGPSYMEDYEEADDIDEIDEIYDIVQHVSDKHVSGRQDDTDTGHSLDDEQIYEPDDIYDDDDDMPADDEIQEAPIPYIDTDEEQADISTVLDELDSIELDITQEDIAGDIDMEQLLREYGFEQD